MGSTGEGGEVRRVPGRTAGKRTPCSDATPLTTALGIKGKRFINGGNFLKGKASKKNGFLPCQSKSGKRGADST